MELEKKFGEGKLKYTVVYDSVTKKVIRILAPDDCELPPCIFLAYDPANLKKGYFGVGDVFQCV